MRKSLKNFIAAIALLCIAVSLLLCACNDSDTDTLSLPEANDAYAQWMSYVDDDVKYKDLVNIETHNSGAVNCTLLNLEKGYLNWLNCQNDDIYTQLTYGVRLLDVRINQLDDTEADDTDKIFCSHGLGTGIKLIDAIKDIKRFLDQYPTEIISMTIAPYSESYSSSINAADVKSIISLLSPEQYAFPCDYDFSDKTMGELRASGKRIIIGTKSEWCDYANAYVNQLKHTWSGEYNFGVLADGDKMYDNLRAVLSEADDSQRVWLSLNRACGDSLNKILPLDYMLYDRDNFNSLISELSANKTLLKRVGGFSLDFATYDYVQCGKALLLNIDKGNVSDPTQFKLGIEAKLNASTH